MATPPGPYLNGSPKDYALYKSSIFPDEGGPAILEIKMPKEIADFGVNFGKEETRFGRAGTEALRFNWDQVETKIIKVETKVKQSR